MKHYDCPIVQNYRKQLIRLVIAKMNERGLLKNVDQYSEKVYHANGANNERK